jgi:hypothetical protein
MSGCSRTLVSHTLPENVGKELQRTPTSKGVTANGGKPEDLALELIEAFSPGGKD